MAMDKKEASIIIIDASEDEVLPMEPGKTSKEFGANMKPVTAEDFIPLSTGQARRKGRGIAAQRKPASRQQRQPRSSAAVSRKVVPKSPRAKASKAKVGSPTALKKMNTEPHVQIVIPASPKVMKGNKVTRLDAPSPRKRVKKEPCVVHPTQQSLDTMSMPSCSGPKRDPNVETVDLEAVGSNEAIDVDAEWDAKYGWRVEDAVASVTNLRVDTVRSVVGLLQKDCTIPFIARYRREVTGGLASDALQDIQETYNNMLAIKKKAQTIVKTLEKAAKGDAATKKMIYSARTMEELDHLYAPFKESKGRSYAQRAKALGLEESAKKIIQGEATVSSLQPERMLKAGTKGLESVGDVVLGWQHIIADFLAKDRDVLDYLSKMSKYQGITMKVVKSASALKKAKQAHAEGKKGDDNKYDNYADFCKPITFLQPHQVMAINRGESQKVLTVKVVIPPSLSAMIKGFCRDKLCAGRTHFYDVATRNLIDTSVEDAYSRLLEPHLCRHIRSSLTKEAEKESVNVFRSNLRQLLLTPPVRGHTVLGIDPGYKHGCKVAVVSPSGELLSHAVIYPHGSEAGSRAAAAKLTELIKQHRCDLIALGDATASRETEVFLSNLISRNTFAPLEVKYCTVPESGVSIYSVTKEAEEELPNLDPNIRSAVGLARRLQDPLLEYVKVEPKHLGVGMYQHDISESVMKNALEGVVVECVSFVGVDINVCPESVLRKVSGLNAGTAKNIIEWRRTHGPFKNRKQLLTVKRLGNKAFEQCAGFVKIFKKTSQAPCHPPETKKAATAGIPNTFEPLDMTIIHPESYQFADNLISYLGLCKEDIGQPGFIETVRREASKSGVNHFVNMLGGTVATMQLIVDTLQQSVEHDIRSEHKKPVFRRSIIAMEDLHEGEVHTGRVKNCTHFGAFVDIGVGKEGLIHISKMRGFKLNLGDRVTVKIASLEVARGRIGLQLISVDQA